MALIGGSLNVAVNWAVSDGEYSVQYAASDFLIGAGFGAASYGVGLVVTTEFLGVSAAARFAGVAGRSVTWGQATAVMRVGTLSGLNVIETMATARAHGKYATTSDVLTALFWGGITSSASEGLSYLGRVRKGQVLTKYQIDKAPLRAWSRDMSVMAADAERLYLQEVADHMTVGTSPRLLQGHYGYLRSRMRQLASTMPSYPAYPDAQLNFMSRLYFTSVAIMGDAEPWGASLPIEFFR
jgi:hypothetical protein